jgi:hypothetical protein
LPEIDPYCGTMDKGALLASFDKTYKFNRGKEHVEGVELLSKKM